MQSTLNKCNISAVGVITGECKGVKSEFNYTTRQRYKDNRQRHPTPPPPKQMALYNIIRQKA